MYEVMGICEVNYTNKQGKLVHGNRLAVAYEDRKWINGKGYDVIFCNGPIADNVKIGDIVKILYNRFGNVDEVVVLD